MVFKKKQAFLSDLIFHLFGIFFLKCSTYQSKSITTYTYWLEKLYYIQKPWSYRRDCVLWVVLEVPLITDYKFGYTGWGKSELTVVSMWNTGFILVLLFINYYIVFHTNNCKPSFVPPYIEYQLVIFGWHEFINKFWTFFSQYWKKY